MHQSTSKSCVCVQQDCLRGSWSASCPRVFVKMRNPMILVAIVAVMLAAIVVGFTWDDKTTPTTQLPRLR